MISCCTLLRLCGLCWVLRAYFDQLMFSKTNLELLELVPSAVSPDLRGRETCGDGGGLA